MTEYEKFLERKSQLDSSFGFEPTFIPGMSKDFQSAMIEYSCLKGRAALFEDCGLGKTLQQLAWAENVVRNTNKNVLIFAPLAVSSQTVREGEKFGIECKISRDGKPAGKISITNYERLHLFDSNDYIAGICDESSIIKNYDGVYRKEITEFLRKMPYRLLCTATDSIELKEEKLMSFSSGETRVLITKPKIGGFGMNWQHCSHVLSFATHSLEQDYQGKKRCHRFGNPNTVIFDRIATKGEMRVIRNIKQKEIALEKMFTSLVEEMRNELSIERSVKFTKKEKLPQW